MKKVSKQIRHLLFGKFCLKYDQPDKYIFALIGIGLTVIISFLDNIVDNVFLLKFLLVLFGLMLGYLYLLIDYKHKYIKQALNLSDSQEILIKKNIGNIQVCHKIDALFDNYDIMIIPKNEFTIDINYQTQKNGEKIPIAFKMTFYMGYKIDHLSVYNYFKRFSDSSIIDIRKIMSQRVLKIIEDYHDVIFGEDNVSDDSFSFFGELVVYLLHIEKLGINRIKYS